MKNEKTFMDDETFWNLIEQSNQEKTSIDKSNQGESLENLILNLSKFDKLGFFIMYKILYEELKIMGLEEIAVKMMPSDKDEVLEGFVNWVIVLGKAHYHKAKNTPQYLLTLDDPKLLINNKPYFPEFSDIANGLKT